MRQEANRWSGVLPFVAITLQAWPEPSGAQPPFVSTPWSLKRRGDWAVTEGINHFVWHVYIHQPDARRAGINAWFGTEFKPHLGVDQKFRPDDGLVPAGLLGPVRLHTVARIPVR